MNGCKEMSKKIVNLMLGCAAGITLLSATAQAQPEDTTEHGRDRLHGSGHEHDELEEIVVTATPLGQDVVEISQSATVLGGAALERELANNIGDTLARLPGLANASFGENVGRPVIRGLQGGRVGILNDSMASFDASAISQDHAVPIEPFLADQVEVLRGPNTLLFGSGAIGGVVNVVSQSIPESMPGPGASGRALLQLDSASDQRNGAARLDFGAGGLAWHANAFIRRSDDYEIPGDAHLFPEEDEEHDADEVHGVLENSFLDNHGGTLGGAWIGERWRAGLSWTTYDADYGIPGAHALHEESEHEEDESPVTIGLENRRVDALLAAEQPFRGFEAFQLNLASTRYTHTEFEGEETGTVFDSDSFDARLELRHTSWGRWSGAFGAQYTDRDFSAQGEEAFVPPSTTDTRALFWVESAEFEIWRLELGARYEDQEVRANPSGRASTARSFTPMSFSAAAVWHLDEASHLSLTLASAERAPGDAELFSWGPHVATQTFEIGDPDLVEETNRHVELAYRVHQGPLTGSISLYHDNFDDYLFQADTGQVEDGLPVRMWAQQDAEFTGGEVELRWDLGHHASGHWQLSAFYDRVRAELADGTRVPRLPPSRLGLGVDWDHGPWTGHLAWIHAAANTRTAPMETPTPGHDLLNAELTRLVERVQHIDLELFLQARNLLDEDIRNSTSFLKDQAPQAGRNFILGARIRF